MKSKIIELAKTICRTPVCLNRNCPSEKCAAYKYAKRAIKAGYRPGRYAHWKKITKQKAYTDKHGEEAFRPYSHYICSECDTKSAVNSPFCPECGAKMEDA